MNQSVLVVDDDKKSVELVKMYLINAGYLVFTAYDGRQAIVQARQNHPDLILLDLMLPKLDGLDVCRVIRAESKVPIIMLTARTTEEDKLVGLDLGADDYITKPFSPREVLARIKAVLRRTVPDEPQKPVTLQFGDLFIDFKQHETRLRGFPVHLTPKEFKILELFTRHPGKVFTREELMEHAFGRDYERLERTIDVHILNLRKKIERVPAKPTYIKTVYGIGYKFTGEEDVS